ncbi:hypothetical protein Hanom_Chr12g01096421 [Helianthus anomalus]
MCYVFTLLLHIKTDVKQPQGLCIVPNLEVGAFLVEAKKVLTLDEPPTAWCVCLAGLPNLTSSGLWSNWVMRRGWCAPRRSPSPRVVERDTPFLSLDDFCFAFCCRLGD